MLAGLVVGSHACTCAENDPATRKKVAQAAASRGGTPHQSGGSSGSDQSQGTKSQDPQFFKKLAQQQSKYRATKQGRFRAVRGSPGLTKKQQAEIQRLKAIGYAGGKENAPDKKGVTVYDEDRAQPGYNFYTSGHQPSAILMDMKGNVVHRWRLDFLDVWPEKKRAANTLQAKHWRRARMLEDGSVLAIFEGKGIIKVDPDSNLVWVNDSSNAHHDLEIMPNGDIYVLGRKAHMVPRISKRRPLMEEFILLLGPDGEEKKRVSLLECWENTDKYKKMWRPRARRGRDAFHTNTVDVLDEGQASHMPAAEPGDVLISSRHIDTLAVVDLEEEKVVWAHKGRYRGQHDPRILDNGHLMLFDNDGAKGRSSVLEYSLPEMKVVWSYTGTQEHPFYSHTCGANSVLANGNVLVTETDGGRAFELTRNKEIVWEFYNPARAGDEDQYIATISEVQRLPPDTPLEWADNPPE